MSLVTPPTQAPVGIDEFHDHAHISHNSDDADIARKIAAATQYAEFVTNRQILAATYDAYFWSWPEHDEPIRVPKPLTKSITSIKYIDGNGTEQTLGASLYTANVAALPAEIWRVYGAIWPPVREQWNAVTVRFVCGWDDAADVPEAIKVYILMLAKGMYEAREFEITGTIISRFTEMEKRLLWPHRIYRIP